MVEGLITALLDMEVMKEVAIERSEEHSLHSYVITRKIE